MFTGCLLVDRHWRQGLRTAATLELTSYLATQFWRLARFFKPEFRSWEARWEETPHPVRYSRHPLPTGEGWKPSSLTALSLGERVACCRRVHQPERAGWGVTSEESEHPFRSRGQLRNSG